MTEPSAKLAAAAFSRLSGQVDELLTRCRLLEAENASLREKQADLTTERAHLIEKHEQARSRVESMISRLKAMEAS